MGDIIRLDKKVPVNYVAESRDMQTLLRLLTMATSNVKLNADNIKYVNNPLIINNRLLGLLCTKLGFYTRKQFKDDELRYTLDIFNYLVRNKGSRKSITEAIKLFFYINNISGKYVIDVNDQTREVGIYLDIELRDTTLLEEIFRYILPTGYFFKIYFYKEANNRTGYEVDTDYTMYSLLQTDHITDDRNAASIYRYPEPQRLTINDISWQAFGRVQVTKEVFDATAIRAILGNSLTLTNEGFNKVSENGKYYLDITVGENTLLPNDVKIEYQTQHVIDETESSANTNEGVVRSDVVVVPCDWYWVGKIEQSVFGALDNVTSDIINKNKLVDAIRNLPYIEDLSVRTTDNNVIRKFGLYKTGEIDKNGKEMYGFEIYSTKPTSVLITKRNVVRSVDTTPIHNVEK